MWVTDPRPPGHHNTMFVGVESEKFYFLRLFLALRFIYCVPLLLHCMGQAMSTATRPWKLIAPLNTTLLCFFLSFVIYCVQLLMRRMGQAMSTATRPWKLIAPLNSTLLCLFLSSIVKCVLLLLRRMGQAMSIETCPWKLIAPLNSTPLFFTRFCFAFVASKFVQNHPLLRCSQQMLSNSEVDTTPLVAHCAGPIFCPFFSIARFTIKTTTVSCSRTSATRRIVDKKFTIHFCDKHAGVAIA